MMTTSKRLLLSALTAEEADEVEALVGADAELGAAPAASERVRVVRAGAVVAAAATVLGVVLTVLVAFKAPSTSKVVVEDTVGLIMQKNPWACTNDGDDCRETQCCSKPGSQCYVKNQYWASCNSTCVPGLATGVKDGAPWACDPLGERTGPACSWEGENCALSKCCRRKGFKCFEREPGHASCELDCSNLQAASSKPWNCNVLGGDQGLRWVQPSQDNPTGTSLFCFAVITANAVVAPGVKAGYEQELLTMMRQQNLSIYACDAAKVYKGAKAAHGNWKSVVNTDIFINVWNQVKREGLYREHDWTVKVDADAVFLPFRLKAHLASLAPPAGAPVYLHNIEFRFHFMGALEVLSKEAVDVFHKHMYTCQSHIASNGGEDYFTMQCLDAMMAAHMTDFSLLDDKYTHGQGWNLFDVNPCVNPAIVAFHPYKAANSWLGCYKVAMEIQSPKDFVGCDFRWHGDACSLDGTVQHNANDAQPSDGIVLHRAF